ncbi:MAG TPA: SMR family transporter [Sporosarcina sp.]|nr:SMR family transporter [Sporosarcina sp.]
MGWFLVFLAAVSEITGVIGLKLFTQARTIRNTVIYVSGFALSFVFLYAAFKYLQVSIAYSVWIGIGTAGAVLVNMIFLGESRSIGRIISVGLIVIGVVGLKAIS